jgi:hypothetical protein
VASNSSHRWEGVSICLSTNLGGIPSYKERYKLVEVGAISHRSGG